MSSDPEGPRVDPSKFLKKPKPTTRVMVDLELDTGWLTPNPKADESMVENDLDNELGKEDALAQATKIERPAKPEPPADELESAELADAESVTQEMPPEEAEEIEDNEEVARMPEDEPPQRVPIRETDQKNVSPDEKVEPAEKELEEDGAEGLAELAAMAELTKPMTPVLDARPNAPQKVLEAVVVDTVGEMPPILLGAGILAGLLLFLVLVAIIVSLVAFGNFSFSPLPSEPIIEQFDRGDSLYWTASSIKEPYEEESDALLIVQEAFFNQGGFQLKNDVEASVYWVAADMRLGIGTYQTDITFLTDAPDSGAGLAFLLESNRFYLVEIGPDGFAWIGRCEDGCSNAIPLVGTGWFESDAIRQGVQATNQLQIEVGRGQIAILVNGEEIGFVVDPAIGGAGTVAYLVETGSNGSASALFDNFEWVP